MLEKTAAKTEKQLHLLEFLYVFKGVSNYTEITIITIICLNVVRFFMTSHCFQ